MYLHIIMSIMVSRFLHPVLSPSVNYLFFLKVLANASACGKYDVPDSTSCSPMAWVFDNSTCNPQPYIGSICRTQLLKWQNCAIGPSESGTVAISTEVDQNQAEQIAIEFLQAMSKFFSKSM